MKFKVATKNPSTTWMPFLLVPQFTLLMCLTMFFKLALHYILWSHNNLPTIGLVPKVDWIYTQNISSISLTFYPFLQFPFVFCLGLVFFLALDGALLVFLSFNTWKVGLLWGNHFLYGNWLGWNLCSTLPTTLLWDASQRGSFDFDPIISPTNISSETWSLSLTNIKARLNAQSSKLTRWFAKRRITYENSSNSNLPILYIENSKIESKFVNFLTSIQIILIYNVQSFWFSQGLQPCPNFTPS